YVFDIVKVTKKFQMVVIGATGGIFLMYMVGLVLSLFGVDAVFWNKPTALGIGVSVVIACVAALNLFLDYEFIRQATVAGAPKYMEWYGAFGIMVTLVWLYLEVLRLISLLRN
ncbi:MAG TPA: Bax inhibitor-1/YccA family protein, partial [Acidimicrobiia bacterium]|nr:Bax inhibitor-1/YccA family protein [Acidimicrobiia bacterium]